MNPPAYVFWFKQSEPGTSPYPANITLESLLMNADSLDTFLDQRFANLPQEFIVVNRQEFQVGGYEARKVTLEVNLSDVYIGMVQYAIFDRTNVWMITCSSYFNDFYTWLPEFDKVAHTFRRIDQ